VERVVGTWSCWTLTRCFVPRVGRCELRHRPGRPVRQPITCAEMVQTKVGGGSAGLEADDASRGVANSRNRHRRLRVAIIGRSAHYFRLQLSAAAGAYRFLSHAIPMLHQPSRQQRRGSFLEPDIQQFDDFLADVRSIGQSGQLEALKRNARSREQKLPRRFIFHSTIHDTLPVITAVRYQFNNKGQGY
jgi:hypothetical protein